MMTKAPTSQLSESIKKGVAKNTLIPNQEPKNCFVTQRLATIQIMRPDFQIKKLYVSIVNVRCMKIVTSHF